MNPVKYRFGKTLLKMQTLIIEGSEFLNLLKPVCPKYQFYSCFFPDKYKGQNF